MDKFEQHIKRMKGLRDVYEVGTGQHNILSMLINECEAALRQPPKLKKLIIDDIIVPKGKVCSHCRGTGKDGHDRCDPPNWYICENCGGSGRTAL
jgi:hypothetical protein